MWFSKKPILRTRGHKSIQPPLRTPPRCSFAFAGSRCGAYSPSLQFPSAPGGDVAAFLLTDSTFSGNHVLLDGIHPGYADVFSDVAGYYGPVSEITDPNACTDNPNPYICAIQHNNNFISCATTPNTWCLEDPNTPLEIVVNAFEDEVLTLTPPTTSVPEPSSLFLLLGGIVAAGLVHLTSGVAESTPTWRFGPSIVRVACRGRTRRPRQQGRLAPQGRTANPR